MGALLEYSGQLQAASPIDVLDRITTAVVGRGVALRGMGARSEFSLTVGLPVFNDAVGLRRSVPSVMSQTWRGDMRLLIVDDGSTDETPAVLEELACRYADITVIRNPRNRGRAAARNLILQHAHTDYLAWIDADDVWYPGKLQRQFEALRARGDDRGVLCTCPYQLISIDDAVQTLRRPKISGDQLKNCIESSLYPFLWAMLGRTETFRAVGTFDERLKRRQDYEFVLRFLERGGVVVSTDPDVPLCEYHRTDIGRPSWQIASANRVIWRRYRRLFARYGWAYAYDRRAAQHALCARFFKANGQGLPQAFFGFRRWHAEVLGRIATIGSSFGAKATADTARSASESSDADDLKREIFGSGLTRPSPPVPSLEPETLKGAYEARGLHSEPDTFVLYRIVGNDLPPRHERGQAYASLEFVLQNEEPLPGCEKRWIVNRIADRAEEERVVRLLEAHGQPYLLLPFEHRVYQQIGLDFGPFPEPGLFWRSRYHRLGAGDMRRIMMRVFRERNAYAMNNNGARNLALEDGRGRAKWIMPWDGGCFLTREAWGEIRRRITECPLYKYVLVPMARVEDNRDLLSESFSPVPEEEPQIVFRCDAGERFDEAWPYGRRPKVELFWRLGVPWKTEHWVNQPWDPDLPGLSSEAGQYQFAGWVARLSSGKVQFERSGRKAFLKRSIARESAVIGGLAKLDDLGVRKGEGPLAVDARVLDQQAADPVLEGLLRRLIEEADSALERGPYSVVDKGVATVGTLQDYWFPAPYWWPDPNTLNGRPYLRDPSRRVPGTKLYEPGSERYDRARLQKLCDETLVLALAHHATRKAEYAWHAGELLDRWFLNESTRMTPHLKYAEVRLGHDHDHGTGRGVIQAQSFWYLLEAVRLLGMDGGIAQQEVGAIKAWFAEYLGWLLRSRQGRWAQARTDFHGAYYELQVAAIALFVDASETYVQSMYRTEEKVHHQLKDLLLKGSAAPTPARLDFSLIAWTNLHYLSLGCGRDLWEIRTVRRSIKAAFERLFAEQRLDGEARHARILPLIAAYETCFGEAPYIQGVERGLVTDDPSLSFEGARPFWMLGTKCSQAMSSSIGMQLPEEQEHVGHCSVQVGLP